MFKCVRLFQQISHLYFVCNKEILIRNILYKNLNIACGMGSPTKSYQGFCTSELKEKI